MMYFLLYREARIAKLREEREENKLQMMLKLEEEREKQRQAALKLVEEARVFHLWLVKIKSLESVYFADTKPVLYHLYY